MNSLLVGALGFTDIYYINQDVLLLARLAGWTDQAPASNPYFAAFALCAVLVIWVVHASLLRRAR